MKVFIFAVLLKAFLFASTVVLPESTVAVVNGTAISQDELEREVAKLLPRTYLHSNVDDKKMEALKDKALSSLIESTLLYAYATSKGIKATDDEVKEILNRFEKQYGSKKNLEAVIKQSTFTIESFKKAIKKEETLKSLYKKEIEASFSDEYLKEYYDKNRHKYIEPEKIKIRLIYVRNDPSDPDGRDKAKAKIKEAEELLKKGETFAYVAQTYSNDKTRVMGGDMGYLHKGMLEPMLEDVAFGMKNGEISEIIERDIGYYIIKVEDKSVQNELSFENVKDKLKIELKEKEEDKRKAALLEKLMATAVIIK